MSLIDLGLTAEEERVYRHLLRQDGDLSELDLGPERAAQLTARLAELGLLGADGRAVEPAAAVDSLVRQRVSHEMRHIRAAWEVVRELAEEQRTGRPTVLVERIEGLDNVQHRIHEHAARTENMAVKPTEHGVVRTAEYQEGFLRRLASGLQARTVLGPDALTTDRGRNHVRDLHARGDRHRISDQPVRSMLILDREVAFVAFDPSDAIRGALMIRQPGAVATLVELFEHLWSTSRDLDEPALTPVEYEVLRALARFDKDETAARHLNLSLRKYRSHIADLLSRLGAVNRFQGALRAKERGWL